MKVTKRDKRKEDYNIEKLHRIVDWACEGINDVSKSEIELSMDCKIYDGITTKELHDSLIESAKNLITKLENPSYSKVAARLLNYKIRKEVYGSQTPRNLYDIILDNIGLGLYSEELLEMYTKDEWYKINSFIKHERDDLFEHSGLKSIIESYLVQNRVTKKIHETPQIAFILISAVMFSREKNNRLVHVKKFYDLLSEFYITLPTPVMGGVRTKQKQYSSCTLIECGDNLDSIQKTDEAILKYASNRAGIGILADIRALGQPVRNGAVKHTGIVPFIKKFEATMNSVSQGGIRKGSATVNYIGWHLDFETIVSMRNEKGEKDSRVFGMDISILLNRLFYKRLLSGGNITLFSPEEVPLLKELFFSKDIDAFEKEYERCESDDSIKKKVISAEDYFTILVTERFETARIYIINIDNVNSQSSFLEPVKMSNLCVAGETEIYVRDIQNENKAKKIQIKDLKDFENYEILSYDIENKKIEYTKILNFSKTSSSAKVIKLNACGGSYTSLICTPEHSIYTENRGYIEAKDIKQFDILKTPHLHCSNIHIEALKKKIPVYDITVEKNHNFFANNILIHNCVEITLPTKPMLSDGSGLIALCTLSAINWGKIKSPRDFELPCYYAVRALNHLLDCQDYPVKEAEIHTRLYRPLAIGINNLAYFLAKRGMKYDSSAYSEIHEYIEAMQYYSIKASLEFRKDFSESCAELQPTKYSIGEFNHERSNFQCDKEMPNLKMDWDSLRKECIELGGIANSTLTAIMPSESCLFWEEKVRTVDFGELNFHEICEMNDIDWRELENNRIPIWLPLKDKLKIPTMSGVRECDKIYYNGFSELIKVDFGESHILCTRAHKFLVEKEDGSREWLTASELQEGFDIVEF